MAISAASGTVYGCLDAQREEEDSQKSNMCMSCSSVPLTAAALSAASGTAHGYLDAQEKRTAVRTGGAKRGRRPLLPARTSAAAAHRPVTMEKGANCERVH